MRFVRTARRALRAALPLTLLACVHDAESAIETRGEAVSYVLAEQLESRRTTTVSLADLAPFRWDRLFLFGPGTPTRTVRDSVRVAWPGLARLGETTPDSVNLLVFVGGGQVLAVAALPRRHGDFAPERAGRGYAPAEAVFEVDSTRHTSPTLGRLLR